jgi:hypothetical protein
VEAKHRTRSRPIAAYLAMPGSVPFSNPSAADLTIVFG